MAARRPLRGHRIRRVSPPICARRGGSQGFRRDAIAASSKTLAKGAEAGERLGEAVRAYEAMQDLIGRIMSYASLLYAGDTSDPARAKFYGDAQEKVTALAGDLLFFELELNRLDDAELDAAMADSPLAHYRPWLEDIRKERPHQLSDEIEQLFLEKSVPGAAAWNRLFDDTIASLRFSLRRRGADARAAARQAAGPRRDEARSGRRTRSAETLGANVSALRPDHEHARQGQGDLRPLAEVRGRRRFPPSRQSGRARSRRGAGRGGDRLLSAPFASLLRAQGALVRQGRSSIIGIATRRCPTRPSRVFAWSAARDTVLERLSRLLAAHGRHRAALLRRGLDRRAGAARQGARRLRPSDDALGAPLRPGQLPRQAARRDDAGARTRPRRPSGARRAQRRA